MRGMDEIMLDLTDRQTNLFLQAQALSLSDDTFFITFVHEHNVG